MKNKKTVLFFYILATYVILQFAWWGYHLIELTKELKQDDDIISKRTFMILGEGLVFFSILLFGFWIIRRSLKKELELSQRQNNFLLSVTHELKTPLSANKLYLQTIQKRELEEVKRKELLQRAVQENERLEAMIDNILNASRLENNALKPLNSATNLSELIVKIAERNEKSRQSQFIELKIQDNIIANLDSLFIETILNNLIDNALKYGDSNKLVELYLYREKEILIFGVKNHGLVVPIEQRALIFDKFYRSGNEETRSQKGSGLGLFIVNELVKLQTGEITYLENYPSGSNFQVKLKR
jgi:K+-sensing histidine kinase KdpD